MDPSALAVLQSRIEQLEAKLGLAINLPIDKAQLQQGDSATTNLLNTAQAISNATANHEKLTESMHMASELNNYTDPNFTEKMQQNQMHMQEVAAAEPVLRHHCHCMHQCKQAAPVLESEAIMQVPQMQSAVDKIQAACTEMKADADAVSLGVGQLAESCGAAASAASEHLANVAQKVEDVETKTSMRMRRNGLD